MTQLYEKVPCNYGCGCLNLVHYKPVKVQGDAWYYLDQIVTLNEELNKYKEANKKLSETVQEQAKRLLDHQKAIASYQRALTSSEQAGQKLKAEVEQTRAQIREQDIYWSNELSNEVAKHHYSQEPKYKNLLCDIENDLKKIQDHIRRNVSW